MKETTVSELQAMREAGKEFQLIDVREPHEYEASNMGGEPIPMGDLLSSTDQIRKDVPVVIHCRSGSRSAAVVAQLEKQGFDNVSNLKGGIRAFAQEIDPSIHVS